MHKYGRFLRIRKSYIMLCVSIDATDYSNALKAVIFYNFVELRLDNWALSDKDLSLLFSKKAKILATCRSGYLTDDQREKILLKAIDLGASYVDVEIESSESFQFNIFEKAKLNNCKTIISYHNSESTPGQDDLEEILHRCKSKKTDIIKIVCFANQKEDVERLLTLYNQNVSLISFAMGEIGKHSRVASLLLGAPFTYVSMSSETQTASGQFEIKAMKDLIKLMKSGSK